MNTPFTPRATVRGRPGGGFGFGFAPTTAAPCTNRRRQARREFRDHVRDQRGDAGFGPVSDRASAPEDPVSGRLRCRRARLRIRRPRAAVAADPGGGRGKRGDVRAAILKLLTDRPMHGYEMIQEISERSQQLWKPSPGSVYPTLQLLVDEGLIVGTESEGSKRLFELTDGRSRRRRQDRDAAVGRDHRGRRPRRGESAHRASAS